MREKHTGCDTKTSCKVVGNSKDCCLPLQWSPPSLDKSIDGDPNNQGDVQPVDMFVPVGFGHGSVGNVLFLGIVGFVPVGLRGL